MVKNIIFRLLFEHGGKVLRSIYSAYKQVNKNPGTGNTSNNTNKSDSSSNQDTNKQDNNKETNNNSSGTFGRFSMQNLISTPMSKDEALKILDLNKTTSVTYTDIMEKYNKLVKMNDPEKGGAFYIQNKVFYAKEFLILEFPPKPEEEERLKQKEKEDQEKQEEISKEKNKNI